MCVTWKWCSSCSTSQWRMIQWYQQISLRYCFQTSTMWLSFMVSLCDCVYYSYTSTRPNWQAEALCFTCPFIRLSACILKTNEPILMQGCEMVIFWGSVTSASHEAEIGHKNPVWQNILRTIWRFLPRDAMQAQSLLSSSVRLSVCLSRSWITSKWIKISSKFFFVPYHLQVYICKFDAQLWCHISSWLDVRCYEWRL